MTVYESMIGYLVVVSEKLDLSLKLIIIIIRVKNVTYFI